MVSLLDTKQRVSGANGCKPISQRGNVSDGMPYRGLPAGKKSRVRFFMHLSSYSVGPEDMPAEGPQSCIFPSPSFDGFGFIVIYCDLNLSPAHSHSNLTPPLFLAAVCRIPVVGNVNYGSSAAPRYPISSRSASGGKADVNSP